MSYQARTVVHLVQRLLLDVGHGGEHIRRIPLPLSYPSILWHGIVSFGPADLACLQKLFRQGSPEVLCVLLKEVLSFFFFPLF